MIQHWMVQRNRKHLIRPARRIVFPIFTINHIVKVSSRFIPESPVEGFIRSSGMTGGRVGLVMFSALALPAFKQAQSVVPKRVDFNRLAAPWSDDPVVYLGVHPS